MDCSRRWRSCSPESRARPVRCPIGRLAGIWGARSFIGLGLVLVGIGYLYQRLLFPPRPAGQSEGARDQGP
jgi:hypothetical protein